MLGRAGRWVIVGGLALFTTGCASACKRVAADREAFASRSLQSQEPHVRMSVPFDVVQVLMARELKQVKRFTVPLPSISGVSLGKVTGGVEQVRLRAAPVGQVGFVVRLTLSAGKQKVLEADIEARTTPKIDLKSGTVTVQLSASDIRKVRPRLAPGAKKSLRDYVWKELPPAVRTLVSKKQLEALLGGMSDELLGELANAMRKDLAEQIGEVASFEFDLPDLPLTELVVSSAPGELRLTGRTGLPVSVGVPERPRHASTHQNAVEVRVSGEVATALANWAIDEGEIPQRYGLDGAPDDDGPLIAALDWRRGEPKPLLVHLWTAEDSDLAAKKQCAHLELRATPKVQARPGGEIDISTDDARIDEVEGSAKVRAGVFFSGLGRKSFEFVETLAGEFELDMGNERLAGTVHSAVVDGNEVVFGVLIRRSAPAAPRRR